jgi:hypothetical protein
MKTPFDRIRVKNNEGLTVSVSPAVFIPSVGEAGVSRDT